ncbi:hypothetical protein [Rahnella aceris]|uniref:hypothetical protein n=1 Tax=Rahnella sp. (strain Y9602) TaxID=2703885 RepID=UPI003BA0498D
MANDSSNVKDEILKHVVKNTLTIYEVAFWVGISALVSMPVTSELIRYGYVRVETYYSNSTNVVYSLIITIAPVVFGFVYGDLPLTFLKKKNLASKNRFETSSINNSNKDKVSGEGKHDESQSVDPDVVFVDGADFHDENSTSPDKVVEYIKYMMLTSTQLANRMLRNASLYLFSGVLIAIVGLGFFYTQTLNSVNPALLSKDEVATSFSSTMIALIPKFGILFFIEFIAFFFLKQYRTSMDEFRYYESLKRSREETYAIVRLMMLDGGKINVLNLIEKYGFRTKLDKLEVGQSLDHLEARKLDKSELEILGRIVEGLVKK